MYSIIANSLRASIQVNTSLILTIYLLQENLKFFIELRPVTLLAISLKTQSPGFAVLFDQLDLPLKSSLKKKKEEGIIALKLLPVGVEIQLSKLFTGSHSS